MNSIPDTGSVDNASHADEAHPPERREPGAGTPPVGSGGGRRVDAREEPGRETGDRERPIGTRTDDARIGPAEPATEARLRRLLETSPSAIMEVDTSGRITYANPAAERILRVSGAELVRRSFGAPVWRVTTVNGEPIAPEVLPAARALRGETVVAYEHAVEDPATGERLLLSVNAAPIRDDHGQIIGALAAFVELTERRRIEAALARSEATQRLLADAAARLGTTVVDERATLDVAGQIVVPELADWFVVDLVDEDRALHRVAVAYADPGAAELAQRLRRDQTPLAGDTSGVAQVVATGRTHVVPEVSDAMLAAAARDEESLAILRAMRLRAFVSVPLSARGRIRGAITFGLSAPGRRLGQREVTLFEALGVRIALALDNAVLLRQAASARAEAESANAAKSQFLATMSHEIRTPINAIQGYAQLLELGLAGPITDPQRDYLARLNASSRHLLGLVDDVLDLAKVDAGELRVARDVLQVGPAVEATIDLTRQQSAECGVRLVPPPAPELLVPFVGDEHRVRQILLNLLSNAVKFSDRGSTVTVRTGTVDTAPSPRLQGGPWAYVSVRDQGVGIAADHVPNIFEPFHQVERGHTRTRGGTGLGLAISRRLARLMGGDVTLESVVGRGSTFTLWLPTPGPSAADAASGTAAGMPLHTAESTWGTRGLAEVGLLLREQLDELVETIGARLRADPALPQAAQLRRAELENHHVAFLADAVQTLVAVEEADGRDVELLRDASTIQRVVAELHGRQRQKQGWPLAALQREYALLGDTLDATVRRTAGERPASAAARRLLAGLVARANQAAGRALRHAADQAERDRKG